MSCENEHFHGHSHSHGGDDGGDDHVPPIPTSVATSLNSKVDLPHVTALNLENKPDDLQKLFKNGNSRYSLKPIIKSDADEQLILHIPFLNGSVKLHSIIIRSNGDKYCPKTIKVWKNNRDIDFDNVESVKPLHSLEHPNVGVNYNEDSDCEEEVPESLEDDADFVEHHVPRHIFTGIQHLTLFFKDIYGDEEQVHLHSIELRGEFTELSKDPVITLYESAPNPADHKIAEATKQTGEHFR
ncbi:hypothetical protein FT663_04208 [Candidozyma haemuli var. vulneris]|uniref:PITH domain-containing protein n=1 Tax=Candidozyma haemuli TaxID=45357 RepID=A0A2V1ASQ0_9ASCO|nr:hypothetical protein CXQ85_004333 [[Candida] haemuloni]KAF3987981.1 hypothetical protein FT663_04208 [[Candida] haemuloni var. vulneris]KAF3991794.1 hypothetical protein FT662_01548 [[Candida] haemuloni var. vulneris]PVH20825.1 hypothetical protein CXQ85_004333 [[Candida] haemuloni]